MAKKSICMYETPTRRYSTWINGSINISMGGWMVG